LLHDAQPVEGYLHFPLLGESYAAHGGAATCNGKPIQAPRQPSSADCRNIMITAIHAYIDVRRVVGLRLHNFGSNLYHMMALATGRCEAIITGPCYLWDLAPALPFTRALGHVERFLDGSMLDLGTMLRRPDFGFPVRQPLIVGPPALVAELVETLPHQQV
jgi:fructose-1,6-bisphosphatase/inositol monophosphatase family enzyme